ncbi:unnamed protein product [Alopecurus aequalis]
MACVVPYFAQPWCAAPPPFLPCRPSYSPLLSVAQPRIIVQWQPPPLGWFKLNFDGSVYHDGSGRASIGGVIRDWNGRVLVAFAEQTEHSTVGIVEARALIYGLRQALSCYLGRLVVEGDDLGLVQLLRGEKKKGRIPPEMEDEILTLLGRFSACEVQHIYREGNQVADTLCHEAYQQPGTWKGGLMPLAACEKVRDDNHGVLHERISKANKVR